MMRDRTENLRQILTRMRSVDATTLQMGAEDRDESHINSVGRTTNTLDTEQSLTTLGSKLSSDVAKKSSTSGSEHMIMLHEALAKVRIASPTMLTTLSHRAACHRLAHRLVYRLRCRCPSWHSGF
jgi:hypothetical protein